MSSSSTTSNVTATVVFTRGNSLLSAQSSSKSHYVEPVSGSNHGYSNSHQSSSTSNITFGKANVNDSMDMEDDMMDFLTDDSNF